MIDWSSQIVIAYDDDEDEDGDDEDDDDADDNDDGCGQSMIDDGWLMTLPHGSYSLTIEVVRDGGQRMFLFMVGKDIFYK